MLPHMLSPLALGGSRTHRHQCGLIRQPLFPASKREWVLMFGCNFSLPPGLSFTWYVLVGSDSPCFSSVTSTELIQSHSNVSKPPPRAHLGSKMFRRVFQKGILFSFISPIMGSIIASCVDYPSVCALVTAAEEPCQENAPVHARAYV